MTAQKLKLVYSNSGMKPVSGAAAALRLIQDEDSLERFLVPRPVLLPSAPGTPAGVVPMDTVTVALALILFGLLAGIFWVLA